MRALRWASTWLAQIGRERRRGVLRERVRPHGHSDYPVGGVSIYDIRTASSTIAEVVSGMRACQDVSVALFRVVQARGCLQILGKMHGEIRLMIVAQIFGPYLGIQIQFAFGPFESEDLCPARVSCR